MSIQAMTWALEQRIVTEPTARHVLLCLANYADQHGRGAFPSALTLSTDTGLSERSVRSKLDAMELLQAIRRGNQAIAAAYIARADRRPVVYDLAMGRGAAVAGRDEVQEMHPEATGCNSRTDGVQMVQERGAGVAPNPSSNPSENRKALSVHSRFADWWAVYPKKVGRKPAEQKWQSRGLDSMADKLIADVLYRAANDDGWIRGYVPDPMTYLNQERWNDDLRQAPAARPAAPAAPGKQMQGLMALEEMKRGLVRSGNPDRDSEDGVLLLGSDACR